MTVELVDFSAGVIPPQAIKSAGFRGVIPYFSQARAAWMLAKPARRDWVQECLSLGLEVVANYQYGKGPTADWRSGYDGGARHAEMMLTLMNEAGVGHLEGAKYGPIDDNPTLEEYNKFAAPFFRGWSSVVGSEWAGAYCNTKCIDWFLEDGLCTYFWQHGWDGRPAGQPLTPHPAAHILQYEIDKVKVGGVGIDQNRTLKPYFGQLSGQVLGGDDADWRDNLIQFMGPQL